jgi:O-antigen biosynthesis protein
MRILTSCYTLDLAGLPTFTLTMYKELMRRGHQVIVYSPVGGKLESQMQVVRDLDGGNPEVILAQHTPCAITLRQKFPGIPMVFYCHNPIMPIEEPPQFPVEGYFVINEECREMLLLRGVPLEKIRIIRDFVDTSRFVPTKPLNEVFRSVLFISNYKKWNNYAAVSGACRRIGVTLTCCGAPYGRCYEIEKAINEADLVVSWGRGILEAMSCARTVLSFDRNEGDGYITPESYYEARRDNFSGRIFHQHFNAETLATEMWKYNRADGQENRDLIMKYHDQNRGVDAILEGLEAVCRI